MIIQWYQVNTSYCSTLFLDRQLTTPLIALAIPGTIEQRLVEVQILVESVYRLILLSLIHI